MFDTVVRMHCSFQVNRNVQVDLTLFMNPRKHIKECQRKKTQSSALCIRPWKCLANTITNFVRITCSRIRKEQIKIVYYLQNRTDRNELARCVMGIFNKTFYFKLNRFRFNEYSFHCFISCP